MKTTLDYGKLGLLMLIVSPTMYMNLYVTTFEKPINPGPAHTILPNATGTEQTSICHKLTLEKEIYLLHTNMEKSLKQQCLRVVKDIYFQKSEE